MLLITAATGAWADDYFYLVVDGTTATLKYGDKGENPYFKDGFVPLWKTSTDDKLDIKGFTTITVDASCQNLTNLTSLPPVFQNFTALTVINNLENINTTSITRMAGLFYGCSSLQTLDLSDWNTASVTNMMNMFKGCLSLETIYVGEGWSTEKVTTSLNMFTGCTKLPNFDASIVDKTNAYAGEDGYLTPLPGIAVLNNKKTSAMMVMPTNDVTATYTIKRDISVDVTATMGDGTDGVRYRVKKDGNNKFIPADMEMAAVPALFTVNDAIEQKALTQTQDYIVQIYAIDAEGQPTGDPMTFATFTFEPGIYAVKAVAADGSDYAGETALSNTFKLFQGYEVEVAAKEFITYYKDEPLYVEDEDAVLYTISSVNGDQAVLSDKSDAMPSNTPMLVYNKSNETKVILLIPCAEPDMAITVAPEFQGTLTATTIAASTEGQTNYAFNGKAFVFVKNDLPVGANKAWLSISNSNARTINLVFDDATKITNTNLTNLTNGDWYDLNGRKLNGMPTKKGVYILNGKKVVVK